ncbi:MAG: hypothetical protein HPY67_07540 [Syntrophaceae bacterium]|nr:hypothetical protein [Syntrophaceae bacterium]
MQTRALWIALACAALIAALLPSVAFAQPADAGRTSVSLSVTPVYQFESDFDRGGRFSVQRYGFSVDTSTPLTNTLRAGISVGYDFEKFDFSGTTAFAGPEPWSDIHRFSVGLPVHWRTSESWSVFVSPQIEWYGESGVDDWADALGYGAVFAVSYRFGPGLTVGVGAGVFYRGEETRGFPYLAVDWRITDNLRLTNPFRTSPSGPAGLELAWRLADQWEVAAGGAYRSFRFRLDSSGVAPNGIGELDQTVGYARLTYRMGKDLKLDLYGGAAFNGQMKIADRNGNELGSDDFETAPILALSLTWTF